MNATIGIVSSIGCALCWSIAMILFRKAGDHHPPVAVNLFKNGLGLAFMLPTAWFFEAPLPELSGATWFLVLTSGALGIGIADALVLKALALLGASNFAIVECLYAPFVIGIAVMFFDESFGIERAIGTLAVTLAVVTISKTEHTAVRAAGGSLSGVLYGAAGLLTMAVGVTMMKPAFATVPLLWLITLRLAAGVVASTLVVRAVGLPVRSSMGTLWRSPQRRILVVASIAGSYVAMAMWVTGFKFADASVAAVLNQSSTIFTILMAAMFLNEPLTRRRLAGTAMAVTGVLTVMFS